MITSMLDLSRPAVAICLRLPTPVPHGDPASPGEGTLHLLSRFVYWLSLGPLEGEKPSRNQVSLVETLNSQDIWAWLTNVNLDKCLTIDQAV